MKAFVKRFSTYKTVKMASVISNSLVVDSLDASNSTVTVAGTDIGYGNTGDWLVIDGLVFLISAVKPQADRAALTLASPLDAFNRSLELEEPAAGQTIGGFVAEQISTHWINGEDLAYAIPYLTVSNSDTTAYVAPELDNSGCFKISDYCRLMRKSYRVTVRFTDAGSTLACVISRQPTEARQVSFEDGRSQLENVDYAVSGTAKITALCDVNTGEKDSNGDAILERHRSTWYLAEDGTVSQSEPSRRASGSWATITVKKLEEVETKVIETFAKNKSNHKLEFWSTLDLSVQDDCTFFVYGEQLQSYISYKRKNSGDNRYYYKSGELATTATEKLRGVAK